MHSSAAPQPNTAMSLNPPIRDWHGKRVWIIGASTGIGAALAQRLAREGARLALSARSQGKLAALAVGMPGALVLPLDVRDAAALASAYATIVAEWGGADVTLFNAGTYSPMSATAFDLAHMNEHFAINYHGVTNGLAAILPDYLARAASHPCIAIVSSVAGSARPAPGARLRAVESRAYQSGRDALS